MSQKQMNRRKFLQMSAAGVAGLVIASCAPATTAPTEAPAAPTTPPEAPAATPTPRPIAAATATPVPTLAEEKYKEAPAMAELVKAGTLTPVEERLPKNPLVLAGVDGVGKYGGRLRKFFPDLGWSGHFLEEQYGHSALRWIDDGLGIAPGICDEWSTNADNSEWTFHFREGLKWSDGEPAGVDDVLFWWNDLVNHTEPSYPDSVPDFGADNAGKVAVFEKVDDFTLKIKYGTPAPLTAKRLAMWVNAGIGPRWIAPMHYLKQFHPKYNTAEKDFADFNAKCLCFSNPELPTLAHWMITKYEAGKAFTAERNPYYYAVDTEGNQLPYIDKITMTLAENLQVLNLRAVAGEYDIQERHIRLDNLPVLLENQEKGDYTIHLDPALNGADVNLHMGNAYKGDAEIAKWIRNKDFRHALSLGIDRDQLNETFWLGVGTPGSNAPAESTLYSPGPEYRKLWCTYDPDQANQILDKIGLTKKDGEGFRVRTDNGERLRLEMITVGGQFVPYTQVGEMITQQWKKIGIDAQVKEMERNQAFGTTANSEHQMITWANDGSEMLFLFPRHALPVDPAECHMGMAFAKWFASGGTQGEKPDDPEMLRAFEMFRTYPTLKEADQIKLGQELWKIITEQQWSIGTVGQSPAFMGVRVVKNNMGNVPERQINAQHGRTPGASLPPTFYFKS